MIIYIVGYGRSGSTALSRVLEKKLSAINLGEVKYLYRDNKDDLLDTYWLNFKKENKDILKDPSVPYKSFDNIFGFLRWSKKESYKSYWEQIFDRAGLDLTEDVIIDSSKTTIDAFMRGIYLYHTFSKVYFIQPNRSILNVINSMLKGKNSNIERETTKGTAGRLIHTLVVGIPHLLITKLFTQIYRIYGLVIIDINNMQEEVDDFIQKKGLEKSNNTNKLPMIYGNRDRNN